jgi:hypothetical protein
MSLFSRIAGTMASFFQIGGPGNSGWNSPDATHLEARNAANAAYVVARGASPVGANDFVTLGSVPGLTGPVNAIRFAIGTGAAQASVTGIPAGAVIMRALLDVTTPYSGGTTITVGSSGTAALLMAAADSTPTTADIYQADQDTAWDVGASTVRVAVAGAPAAGAGFCTVYYSIPNA